VYPGGRLLKVRGICGGGLMLCLVSGGKRRVGFADLLRTVWFHISGSLISHITPYCATHLVGTIPNKEHPAAIIINCV